MTIVVDANLVVGTVIRPPDGPDVVAVLRTWRQNNELLIAPSLLEYEVVSVFRRAITIGLLDQQAAAKALEAVSNLGINLIAPSAELSRSALFLAERIGHSKAYDSQYLALAARENVPFWTADRQLARAAQSAGLAWTHWIGELTTDHESP